MWSDYLLLFIGAIIIFVCVVGILFILLNVYLFLDRCARIIVRSIYNLWRGILTKLGGKQHYGKTKKR